MLFEHIEYWHWWVFGIVLIILELFVPGAFFLWLGISASVVGVLMWLMPDMSWQYQWLTFALFSVVSIVLWRQFMLKRPSPSDHPTLNRRGEQYIGRVFTLNEAIVDGVGKIRVDDTMWKIAGEDCPVGSKVKVIEAEGAVLKVAVEAH
jgi:membrane protein implicated in regulation of membrane protease activity